MYQFRRKDWQQSPYLKQGRAKVAQARRDRADELDKHIDHKGHQLVRLELPAVSGPRRFLTCARCRARAYNIGAMLAKQCPKKPAKTSPASMNWWRKYRDQGLQPLLDAWKVTQTQADEYFDFRTATQPVQDQEEVPLWLSATRRDMIGDGSMLTGVNGLRSLARTEGVCSRA